MKRMLDLVCDRTMHHCNVLCLVKMAGKQKKWFFDSVFFPCVVHKKIILFYLQCCYGIALYVP